MISRNPQGPGDEWSRWIIIAVILSHTDGNFLEHILGIVKRADPSK
jgi:hypothetical protein